MMTEDGYKIAVRMQDAADRTSHAADRIEAAVQRLALMLEDGYGGNGLRLMEALEKQTETEIERTK